jgi:hypothetical protein
MKLQNTLLMAAFGLLISAITARAADIPITSLPLTIATAGKYVLNSDLPFTGASYAYTITVTASDVTIDLRGHTLTGGTGILIQNSNVTVKNGTINTNLYAENSSNIALEKISFGFDFGVWWSNVKASTINRCNFMGVMPGQILSPAIEDSGPGGNTYSNNSFGVNNFGSLQVAGTPLVIERASYAPPTTVPTVVPTITACVPTVVQITTLPFNIVASGTYVLPTDLNFTASSGSTAAITVSASNVTIDFKGHALTQESVGNREGVQILGSNVTVKNGTIAGFADGIFALGNAPGTYPPFIYLTDLKIDRMIFTNNNYGIDFEAVNSSIIKDCTFIAPGPTVYADYYGIVDRNTAGGNSYTHDSFEGTQVFDLWVTNSTAVFLKDFRWKTPVAAAVTPE